SLQAAMLLDTQLHVIIVDGPRDQAAVHILPAGQRKPDSARDEQEGKAQGQEFPQSPGSSSASRPGTGRIKGRDLGGGMQLHHGMLLMLGETSIPGWTAASKIFQHGRGRSRSLG